MQSLAKKYYISIVLIFLIFLPILLFFTADVPQRTLLKTAISFITIVAFFILIGQFLLSRINRTMITLFKISKIINIHKLIAYIVLPIFIIHPFLIVFPRFFEAGPKPLESFIKMLTTFDSIGVVLGIITWILMFILGLTSIFREKLNISYKNWKLLHGILSLIFIISAAWHSIDLGRDISIQMAVLIIVLTIIVSILLLKTYIFKKDKKLDTKGKVNG